MWVDTELRKCILKIIWYPIYRYKNNPPIYQISAGCVLPSLKFANWKFPNSFTYIFSYLKNSLFSIKSIITFFCPFHIHFFIIFFYKLTIIRISLSDNCPIFSIVVSPFFITKNFAEPAFSQHHTYSILTFWIGFKKSSVSKYKFSRIGIKSIYPLPPRALHI